MKKTSRIVGWLAPGLLVLFLAASPPVKEPMPELEIMNAITLPDGVLTGGQPTAEQLSLAAEQGFETVISLRAEGELSERDERAEVEALGMRFVSIPVTGPDDLTEEKARALVAALKEAGDTKTMVHCASGNRVGALYALKAFYVDHRPATEAVTLGQEAGLRSLQPIVEEILTGNRE